MNRVKTYVSMLRGVNVSGQNKIAMGDLRATFVGLGHSDVQTYIQSGNVISTSRSTRPLEVASAIEKRIERDCGLAVKVVVRTKEELALVLRDNPFLGKGTDPTKLHVTFLADRPDPTLVSQVEEHKEPVDEFGVGTREVYLHCPAGYGRTKLNNAFWERRLRVAATTRNWKTVTTLLVLAGG
jgi:uncharacterized protein (DUF1697 family)